jgi:hypothetical protein
MVGDILGITMMYPSYEGSNDPFYFPFSLASIEQNGIGAGRLVANGTFSGAGIGDRVSYWEFEQEDNENDVEMAILPSSMASSNNELELELDCDLNHEETHNVGMMPGLEEDDGWRDTEMTSHFFVKSVSKTTGYIFFEARSGVEGTDKSIESGCCQATGYGVRLYWDNTTSGKGKIAFYKREFAGSTIVLDKVSQLQPTIDTFYQKWFAAKFVIATPERGDFETNPVVLLQLFLSPVVPFDPANAASNVWRKVAEVEDKVGFGWNDGGGECDAPEDDFPITWANYFVSFGWKDGKVIQFANTSFREIDMGGTFGEDPEPDPTDPDPDPEVPLPDPDPPSTPPNPPPDAEPPLTPTTVTKRLTIRREILNNRFCSCDGQVGGTGPPPDPGGGGGGGGGGGTGTLLTLFNHTLSTTGFARLAKVSNSSGFYLRFGQGVTQTNSAWINKPINRVEITIAEFQNPRGGTGGGVHCRIRKGSDDSIAATLSPVATEENILNAGIVCVFENLQNTYKMVFGDKLLFEYDGGDQNNYIKIFRRSEASQTGTKIVWQANDQDAGEYRYDAALDVCMRVYTMTGQVSGTSEDDNDTE